ncbi:hypothetical protein EXW72_05465 [Pseudomonas sp. BCA14]|uniref:membrane-targeted effector domain-containing toxin n=1 Tax=unclassified Pseudomonas TaxID=196821 RepID=UPI00106EB6E9|nr:MULTISPECIES: membrane-targeted effector domain-containing toxin [unclassified Pseudomonas]TFF14258.1 hypothetical protein EXW70_07020 [Pseudomonas sp. JMN1]TFF15058.1 hypothetical protein EXW71_02020 [Pseudomonas sp. BCA17]TFF31464.1 hypothetical protein EXW72_05465 [Pseudomonas sp. BCA14]TFF32418.1 hypothetical protein EXW73_01270 [Pseudomonas sp. BCA13]
MIDSRLTSLAGRRDIQPLGNLGGALSWPVPPSIEQQRAIETLVADNTHNLPGFTRLGRAGALDYLMNVQPLSAVESADPDKALETLLKAPQAEVLGTAIQARVEGIATDTSVADYVLAAIHIGLDPESISAPHRNKVANFDLASERHWGKSAAEVVDQLSIYLEQQARTAKGRGALAARVLLATKAPQFLVKDIPPQVVYGSQAWANFCINVATQEAQAPGTVRNKTYAQVMIDAESSETAPDEATLLTVLIDWAVCNGHLPKRNDDRYDSEEIARAQTAFNDQQRALRTASSRLGDALPSRKAMALATLKAQFPQVADDVFEKRVLSIKDREFNPGARSMLDITMEGHTLPHGEAWQTFDKDVPLKRFNTFSQSADVNTVDDFKSALDSHKQMHQTLVSYLIANLPLEDRENLEQGEIEFYKEGTYKIGLGLLDAPELTAQKNRLLIKVTRNKQNHLYALDPEKGLLSKRPNLKDLDSTRISNTLYKTERVQPQDKHTMALQEARISANVPKSFASERTRHIANVYVEALGLEQQARGITSYDKERGQQAALTDFLLDLIPLRSAIVNFRDGDYGAGALDLTLDIFALITAGLGAGAKTIKALKNTGAAANQLLKVGKIFGAATLGELNPLSGTGDLWVGAGKLLTCGMSSAVQGIKKLRGTAMPLDLMEAGDYFDSAANGTFKAGGHTVEGSAVLFNGKWYAFDAHRMQPYGSPLEDFSALQTLAPSPNTHTPGTHRVHPYHQNGLRPRPRITRKELPEGSYPEATKGKLEAGHFIRGDGKDETIKKFVDDMFEFYDEIARNPVPRPTMPPLTGDVEIPELISRSLQAADGIVFGEKHDQMASFRLLAQQVDTLVSQNVKKVYFEGLIDLPPYGLVDDGIGMLGKNRPRTGPTFEALKKLFESKGIEVLPLDHYYLTRHKDVKALYGPTKAGFGSVQRLQEFNYHASEVIQANSGTEKWIALVGASHMNTAEGVPGLAELTGAIGIGVFDNPGVAKSIGRKDTRQLPDPKKPLKAGDIPGDFQIYIKP